MRKNIAKTIKAEKAKGIIEDKEYDNGRNNNPRI